VGQKRVMQEVTVIGGWSVHDSVTNNDDALSASRKRIPGKWCRLLYLASLPFQFHTLQSRVREGEPSSCQMPKNMSSVPIAYVTFFSSRSYLGMSQL
jgi:hypothetical protein